MINSIDTNINSVVLNNQNLQNPNNTTKALEKEQGVSKSDSYSLSSSVKLINEISTYTKKLDDIFGVPKELNKDELKKAEQIEKQIEKIIGTDEIKLSKADEKLMQKLDKQIDNIFKDDKVTKEEQKELNSLIKRQDSILNKYEDKELTPQQEWKLESLFKELDSLHGLKTPNEKQLKEAENIYNKLNSSYEKLDKLNDNMDISFKNSAELIKQQNKLTKQLEDIFGVPKKLNELEQKQQSTIQKDIDKILESYEPTPSNTDKKTINSINKQIQEIFKDEKVSKEEEKKLNSLELRMDNIYSKYEQKDISKDDEKKLDKLLNQMDKLYGLKKPENKEDMIKAELIYEQLDLINDKLGFQNKSL